MEGMREVAIAYYERATEQEKDLIKEFFSIKDVNGNENIRLTEFEGSLGPINLLYEDLFDQLDADGDGILDISEVLTLYFMVYKVCLTNCNRCSCLLIGPYYSCLLCPAYDLCSDCYSGGRYGGHEHTADHQSLLMVLRNRSAQAKTSKKAVIDDQLGKIARSYYTDGSAKARTLADEFFKSMDTNGDNRVDLSEFLTFMIMKQEGYAQMRTVDFFSELDKNGDGTLDHWEVGTLYYIIKTGRPFCDGCGKFIPGRYFSCVHCFNGVGSTFTLCLDCFCYPSARCEHTHNGEVQFLDNYTLLKAIKDPALATATGVNQKENISEVGDTDDKKPAGSHIVLKVERIPDYKESFFRISRSTHLKRLMCAYVDLNPEVIISAFIFDGRRLTAEETPGELEMEDGDVINACPPLGGGPGSKQELYTFLRTPLRIKKNMFCVNFFNGRNELN